MEESKRKENRADCISFSKGIILQNFFQLIHIYVCVHTYVNMCLYVQTQLYVRCRCIFVEYMRWMSGLRHDINAFLLLWIIITMT